MRCQQLGKWQRHKRRSNNAALPEPDRVRGKHGKMVMLDVTARRPAIGRADPPRDKKGSRNDHRHYTTSRTPDRRWGHQPTTRFTMGGTGSSQ